MDKKRQISSSSCFLQNIKSGINAKSTATSKPVNPPSNKKKPFFVTKFLPSLPSSGTRKTVKNSLRNSLSKRTKTGFLVSLGAPGLEKVP
jgi:hypothetical protein